MNRRTDFLILYIKTIDKLLAEVGADYPRIELVHANLRGEPGATENFRVKVDRTSLSPVLTESFDGPFNEEDDFLAAIQRRSRRTLSGWPASTDEYRPAGDDGFKSHRHRHRHHEGPASHCNDWDAGPSSCSDRDFR